MRATYCTVSDARYFLGTVALVNSLALTGNEGELVVVDCGLEASQRRLLDEVAVVVPVTVDADRVRNYAKPEAARAGLGGVVAFVDSDVIVTGSLDPLLRRAADGAIAAFPDDDSDRRFPTWRQVLDLSAEPRRQPYVNAGFVALSVERWPELVERWRELCRLVPKPEKRLYRSWPEIEADPFGMWDQDVLNALLMTEVPPGSLALGDPREAPVPARGAPVRVLDRDRLACAEGGRPTLLLHHVGGPKPWEPRGWSVLRYDAFVELLSRLLVGPDLRLRPARRDVPARLRGGVRGRVALSSLYAATDAARAAFGLLPAEARERALTRVRSRTWRRRFER